MEEGRTFRFTNPKLFEKYGEWTVTKVHNGFLWAGSACMAHADDAKKPTALGHFEEVPTGPEPYEEWFK